MATKTITVDLEAYERLRRARLTPDESFSQVIKRAHWHDAPKTAAELLSALERAPTLDPAALDQLDKGTGADAPPEDPWRVNR